MEQSEYQKASDGYTILQCYALLSEFMEECSRLMPAKQEIDAFKPESPNETTT